MFATRTHDENAIHAQQTAAAAKPLNQGVKGLAPKTPGNKASKKPLNDENAAFGDGKTGGKGKEGGLFAKEKDAKMERSAFVTPAGPRTRAPLGNKTTNAKANQLPTPAGAKSSIKPTSPRLRRGKVKIHTAETDPLHAAEPEEREIEYMPPREVPLPDYPDDWPHDRTYPQFEGQNLTRGWWAEYGGQKQMPESDEEMSDFEEKVRKAEEGRRAREAAKQAVERRPATVKARGAASALSSTNATLPKQRATPGCAAPTAAAKARLPSAPVAKRAASASIGTGNTRHTAAKVASNTTLGYFKGRAVSASTRQPLSAIHEKPAPKGDRTEQAPTAKRNSVLDDLLDLHISVSAGAEDGEDGLSGSTAAASLDALDDELDDFQLQHVEL